MIALDTIPDEVLRARGCYSTVRSAHEDEKKELQKLCSQLQAVSAQILRKMQPDDDGIPDSVGSLIDSARATLNLMERCAGRIESLAKQRAELKVAAWTKQPKEPA